jgi:hypothetical protein
MTEPIQVTEGDKRVANSVIHLCDCPLNLQDMHDLVVKDIAIYRQQLLSAHHDDLLDRCEHLTHDLGDARQHQRLTEGKLTKTKEALNAAKSFLVHGNTGHITREEALTLIAKVMP